MAPPRFLCIEWHHDSSTEPIQLWHDVNASDAVVRQVEVFGDGSLGLAARVCDTYIEAGAAIGEGAVPAIDEINRDPQFSARIVERDEFEDQWRTALLDKNICALLTEQQPRAVGIELGVLMTLHLDADREKPLWGEANRSVVFSFPTADEPLNVMAEFSTPGGRPIAPGTSATDVHVRFLGSLHLDAVVLPAAECELWMGGRIGTGVLHSITKPIVYGDEG